MDPVDASGNPAAVSLPQLCYDVAYFILPHFAFNDLAKLVDLCTASPGAAGAYYYVMAALARKMEPDADHARRFLWHVGELRPGQDYLALEYPEPPPIDLMNPPFDQLTEGAQPIVLAPHFSAIVREGERVGYYVLGQSPQRGGTTLRCVTSDGANCNLGPGPAPELDLFLAAVRERQ